MRTTLRWTAAAVFVLGTGPAAASAQQTATWYISTYTNDMLVWDEASEQIVDRIEMKHPIPNRITMNEAKTRLYVLEASGQNIEIVDVASREAIDEFTLSHDSVSVRIDGFAPHPSDERAILFVKRYTKHSDRYTVEGPFLLDYDIASGTVTDTIPWPGGETRNRAAFRYSPDGETLYFFTDDIIAVDAETYEEVDRWDVSAPLEPGLGSLNFGTESGTYDAPGVATSLYRMRDPVHNTTLMGIATVRLSEKDIDFYTLGPSEPVGSFVIAPDGRTGYGLYTTVGRYEFWEFDLVERRVTGRHPFAGRPRMGLEVSADGSKLFIHVAGNTIDVYDAQSFEFLRTVEFDVDMTPRQRGDHPWRHRSLTPADADLRRALLRDSRRTRAPAQESVPGRERLPDDPWH